MTDKIFERFLIQQCREGLALARQSDIVELTPIDEGGPPQRYVARFACTGLAGRLPGGIREVAAFHVGISFPEDYLRRPDAVKEVLSILWPFDVFHPNVYGPAMCLGRLLPGTGLVDLLYQSYEVLSFHRFSPHDGLNISACEWARHNQHRFPTDKRPLKRLSRFAAGGGGAL